MTSTSQQTVPTPAPQEINELVALFNQARFTEAATLAQSMTVRFPQHGFGWKALGTALKQMGRNAEALAPMQKAVALSPGDPEGHSNLGITFQDLGRLNEAEACFRKALQINPDYANAHTNLGSALHEMGRLDEALTSYRCALKINPNLVMAHYNLGNTLREMVRLAEAANSYRHVLHIQPNNVEACCNLGVVLNDLGQLHEAETMLRRALEIKPDLAQAYSNLGNTLKELGRLSESETSYRQALALEPKVAEIHNNLGNLLQHMGRLDEAEICYRKAIELNPGYLTAHSNLLFILNYNQNIAPSVAFAEACQYGRKAADKVISRFAEWSCATQSARLRIGFVSGDLRSHPVGYFLENILSQFDQTSLELIAYPTSPRVDELTERIKPYFFAWKPLYGLSDEIAARQIHGDGVHILIDLSGHSRYNRLPLFAWKPAPVQVSWLGYLATTGEAAIDYLIADDWTLPKTEEANFTEKIWRLPESYLCFTPPAGSVEVGSLPALNKGYVTFGSFNNLTKMNDTVVALWARILTSVPSSQLFLKSRQLSEASVRQSVMDRFAAHGIDAGRLILEGPVPRAEYLIPFQRVDIALDPFPYPGITTSVENLWMGVPVLTLAGQSFLARQGVGLMMNAGLPEWIASDPDDYVARAVAHAGNLQALAALRKVLRQQVLASPVLDATRFARHFEAAMRGMWKTWSDTAADLGKASGADIFTKPTSPRMNVMHDSRLNIPARPAIGSIARIGNDMMKLHIGGKEPKAGWKILNALDFEGVDFVGNVCDLSAFPDACCEKVYASHVMEHVGQRDFVSTLKGIHRILCENGEFYFSVPDLEVLCRLFLNPELDTSQRFHVMRMMFGGQTDDYDFHYIGLTYEFMMNYFSLAGFSSVKRVASFGLFNDTSDFRPYGVPISLNLIATK